MCQTKITQYICIDMFSKGHEIDKLKEMKVFSIQNNNKMQCRETIAMDINNTLFNLLTLCNAPS